MSDLAFLPALEQARLVAGKQVSPVELVETYAARIDALNPALNAYITTCLDRAMDEARAAENGPANGPFHGVPISIKDLQDVAGVRSTHGCGAFADRVPDADVAVVARLRRAGFIVLGKTNTPEFGTTPWTEPPAFGPARNPWDTARTPGGSSGGAGAALAAGLCPISHGTDGGGSVRIPSSCCGLFGMKPSRGRVSTAPGPSNLLSTSGPLARTVADAAAMIDVLAGYETGDAFWAPAPERPFLQEVGADPGRLRVAVTCNAPTQADVAPGRRAAVERTAALLSSLGHTVEDASPDYGDGFATAFATAWIVFIAQHEPMPDPERLSPLNRTLVGLARATSATDHWAAWSQLHAHARRIVSFFDDYDVLVTPTTATPPPLVGEFHDPDEPLAEFIRAGSFVPFTPVWNITGQPAVSIPLEHDEEGLPAGVQLVGRPADEATLLRLSAQLEAARPWIDRRPPVS